MFLQCLVPLCNRPLLSYSLQLLQSSGVGEIFVYTTSHSSLVAQWLQDEGWADVRVVSNPECRYD